MRTYKPIESIEYNSFVEGVLTKQIKFKLKKDYTYKIPDDLTDESASNALCIISAVLFFAPLLSYPIVAIICKSWFKLIGLVFFASFFSMMFVCGDKIKKSQTVSLVISLIIFSLTVYSFLKFGIFGMTTLVLFNLSTVIISSYLLSHILFYIEKRRIYKCIINYKESFDDAVLNQKILFYSK